MMFTNLFKVAQADRGRFCEHIIESSAPRPDFHFLVILSTLIVSLGLIADNSILVIGGMLVTPLLSPILAISLGIVINNKQVIKRSVRIFLTAFALASLVAFAAGLFSTNDINEIKLIDIMKPSLFSFIVSIVAGVAASFTWVKPDLNNTLPGIAVTVTLIPPLTSVGLALAKGEIAMARDVFSLLVINVSGILLASIAVFSLMDFYKAKRIIISEVKEEEKKIEKAAKQAAKNN